MLKSFTERIYKQLVNIKPGRVIFNEEQRDEILYLAKRVRTKDYIVDFDLDDGQVHADTITTTANWYFILTGVAVLCEENSDVVPLVGLKFQNFYPTSPFGSEPENFNDVPYDLVLGREGKGRFEEYKNLYYSLGERVTINVDAIHKATTPQRVSVILTGIEVNVENEGEG